ncbi:RagB/SusD family nutrient uptake outer membrane protein [Chitinophaga nivalis]|uniref:RagB/SusD family nutrient uptake outer membrane protein n=1 Tax=Chitinophaga nivalis TaxID=2991709 RepID=A0ABT3IHG1_9BACT|nr:RagB/SusD family nutrient uptake outer membrane protein [Chitinophaga nivalis]MCW3466906.1 RagB/SusD family nutrient uptake outer membrane protein [Chitinophaga nivalis]MCW3483403.1 RagB/SusD family nutrient uptake outer membrane protein [Chitinophaga nivalis]
MRKIINTLALIATVAATSSCNKKLDVIQEGTPTVADFWQTEKSIVKGLNAAYQPFDDENFYGRGCFWFIDACDDMIVGRGKPEAEYIKNFDRSFIGGSYTEGQWDLRYNVIKRANDILRYAPAIPMSTENRNRYMGEAYFLSGLMYYQLAYNYGDENAGVPIVDKYNPTPGVTLPRAQNVNVNYDSVIVDLKKAASLLPYFGTYKKEDFGHAHKTAAFAYLAKTYLFKKDYANAERFADSVILSGKHRLLDNFSDVFTVANNWTDEYIWSAYSTAAGAGGWGSILPGVMLENTGWGKYNGWGYYTPTKELYDEYETGDLRREATILKPGDEFKYFGEMRTYKSNNSLSGYQFRKYMEPFGYSNPIGTYLSPSGDHPTTALNPPLMRYAEVLLIKAEAALMQGKNADNEINAIRKRAGLKPVTNATMVNLKHERRCELAGEWADRHRDLVRWGDAQAAYAKPLHGVTGAEVWPARDFNPKKHHVWPVPQRVIDASGGLYKQSW